MDYFQASLGLPNSRILSRKLCK